MPNQTTMKRLMLRTCDRQYYRMMMLTYGMTLNMYAGKGLADQKYRNADKMPNLPSLRKKTKKYLLT